MGKLSQARFPMIPTTHRRCNGGRGKVWGHLAKPGPSRYRPHTGGAIVEGGEDRGHISQARSPMIPAIDRRCYGGGVKFGNTFSKPDAP